MKSTLLFLTLTTLLFSCGKESKTAVKDTSVVTTVVPEPETSSFEGNTTEKALQMLIYKTDSVKKHLTKENALSLYLKLRAQSEALVGQIGDDNHYVLDNYYQFLPENSETLQLPDSLRVKYKNFERARVEFWEIGEGYVEIRTKADYYVNIFDGKLPADYNDYIKLEAQENKNLLAADAGLIVPLKDLSSLVLGWEHFLQKHPDSKLYKEAKAKYKSLLEMYLFGLDNTPTMENNGDNVMELYEETQKEFERFLSKNPTSVTSKLVSALLDGVKKSLHPDDLNKRMDQEFLKYPITQ